MPQALAGQKHQQQRVLKLHNCTAGVNEKKNEEKNAIA